MIEPYRKPRPHREIAWLLDAGTVLGEEGQTNLVEAALPRGVQVWAPSELLRQLTRDGHGSAVLWRYVAIGWHPRRDASSWPVRGLALEAPAEPGEALDGLRRWRDWLESYGAAPAGSLGGSGLSLVKASLERPLWTSVGRVPPIKFTMGGRQETAQPAPAHYRGGLVQSDIQAAYANTLGAVLYGGRWERYDWRPLWRLRAEKNPGLLMYVRAAVDIPDLGDRFPQLPPGHRGPLLDRPRRAPHPVDAFFWLLDDRFPSGRRLQGTWTWAELEAATEAGCKVRRVLDVWIHESGERPFYTWLERIHEGRGLPGFAGRLAKATGNATWGQFAISKGRRQVVARGRDEKLPLRGGNPSQRAFDLAESIAGQVRANLYRGMWAAGRDLVTAHTDGLWTQGGSVLGWRRSASASELRLFDAQHYATRPREGKPWDYTVAGVLDPEEWFEDTWARSYLGDFEAKQAAAAEAGS
jgi:hypothetical protein